MSDYDAWIVRALTRKLTQKQEEWEYAQANKMFGQWRQENKNYTTRSYNVLHRVGLVTPARIRKAIAGGLLRPFCFRNYGLKVHKFVCAQVGAEYVEPPPKVQYRCPCCGHTGRTREFLLKDAVDAGVLAESATSDEPREEYA